jgi:hypothetical protein
MMRTQGKNNLYQTIDTTQALDPPNLSRLVFGRKGFLRSEAKNETDCCAAGSFACHNRTFRF